MTDEREQAVHEAEAAAQTGAAELIERVADKLGQKAGASAVFGEPVVRDGVTVVPVAQMIIGTGAGSGSSASGEAGEGGGGGALTRPLGYIEVSDDGAAFVPLHRPWADPRLVLAYSLLALVVARTLVKLVRG